MPVVKESTALGAALYAGVGAGLHASIENATERVGAVERVYEPDTKVHEQYRSLREPWSEAYARSLEMVEDGLVRPLWRAAGT